jgi:hypothetical protein
MSLKFFQECIQRQIDHNRAMSQEYGWEFKERPAGKYTIGDYIGAVLAIETPEDARRFYEGNVEYLAAAPQLSDPPEKIARANLGWCFGEGMKPERVEMWIKVCDASHPVFGTTRPTPEGAFQAGLKLGKERRA